MSGAMRPVIVVPPTARPRPIVVEVPHAGTYVPPGVRAELLLDDGGGKVLVLWGHWRPSVGKVTHADPGKRRADVVPGDRKGQACASAVTETAAAHFRAGGLSVAVNDPYMGGETTRRLGRPSEGIHA